MNSTIISEYVPLWQRIVPRILQSLAWYPTRAMLKYFLHMQVLGEQNVKDAIKKAKKEKRAILFVSNHITELDPILTTMATSPFSPAFPLFWVAREGRTYKDPDFSWRRYIYGDLFFLAWGAQPLRSGKKNYAESLKRHVWLLEHRYSVCIFPEGGIDPKKKKIGGGLGYLVETLNPVVIPIKITGVEDISSKEFWARERHLTVEFKEAIEAKKLINHSLDLPDRYKDLAQHIMMRLYG